MAKKQSATAQKASKLVLIQAALNAAFMERGELINGMLVGLLARENVFMLGPPGTGKSKLCNALCEALQGRYFSWLLGKTSTPEELYGPPSFSALRDDKYVRVITGKLPEADICFLDEIWKSSSAIANTLLPVLNERVFHNGNGPQKIPLQMTFSASNELPAGEELGALWDRFSLRYVTRLIQDDDNFVSMLNGQQTNIPQMTLEELGVEQQAAMALPISDEAMQAIIKLRREATQQGLYVSDRKWVQISRIVRAQAYLRGHDAVRTDDLEILQNVLWNDDKQIPEVRKLVFKFCYDIGEEIIEVQDGITEISMGLEERRAKSNSKEMTEYGIEANAKLKVLAGKVEKMRKLNPDVTKLAELADLAKRVQTQVQKEALGF